jgi:hypothetical protein
MAFVLYHIREPGGQGTADVHAVQLDAVGCDAKRHRGQAPLLVDGQSTFVWASEGAGVSQFSAAPVPTGFDEKTGEAIWADTPAAGAPVRFDPKTGLPVYETAPAPATAA